MSFSIRMIPLVVSSQTYAAADLHCSCNAGCGCSEPLFHDPGYLIVDDRDRLEVVCSTFVRLIAAGAGAGEPIRHAARLVQDIEIAFAEDGRVDLFEMLVQPNTFRTADVRDPSFFYAKVLCGMVPRLDEILGRFPSDPEDALLLISDVFDSENEIIRLPSATYA